MWLAVSVFLLTVSSAFGSTEAAFQKACAKAKPLDVVSGKQLDAARRTDPTRCLQISGSIQGVMRSGDTAYVIVKLVDEATAEIKAVGDRPELQPGGRVRCLVKPAGRSGLDLLDITWDQTPLDVLMRSAQAALKIPPANNEEISRSAEQVRRAQSGVRALPSRGGDSSLTVRRAVTRFNPRLAASELDAIAGSIVRYCNEYGLTSLDDQLLVVAVIAAESHFNPKARSYKGAAGLGQLMPATAAAHGVDPYDPVQNLQIAIRIICRNLSQYQGQRDQQWLLALAAYNAGGGAVKRHGGVPPYRETRDYLWRIYGYWCELTGRTPVSRK
jgi:hypothetical protein